MNFETKKILPVFLSFTFMILLISCAAVDPNKPSRSAKTAVTASKTNDSFPVLELPIPKEEQGKSYLGLSGSGKFNTTQIKTKILIIEIFSMYCPYCQREAPEINRLYSIIEKSPDLKGKIKLIGIGAGNSPFEVQVFKEKYTVPFPLFSDEHFTLHKCFGEVRTPYFIGVKINDDGSHRIFYSKLGEFKGAEPFLELMLQLSELH